MAEEAAGAEESAPGSAGEGMWRDTKPPKEQGPSRESLTRAPPRLLLVVGDVLEEGQRELILERVVSELRRWDESVSGCSIDEQLGGLVQQRVHPVFNDCGEVFIEYASPQCSITALIRPRLASLVRHLRFFIDSDSPYRHLLHSGPVSGGFSLEPTSSTWLLPDGSFSLEALATLFKSRTSSFNSNSIFDLSVHCNYSESTRAAIFGVCVGKIRLNPEPNNREFVGGRSFVNAILSPLVSYQSTLSLMTTGCLRVAAPERPTLHVFPAGQGSSAMFGVDGFSMLVDGGCSRVPACWGIAKQVARFDVVILSQFGVDNVLGARSFFERIASGAEAGGNSDDLLPDVGIVYCNVGANKPSEKKEKIGFSSLVMSAANNIDVIVESVKKLNNTRLLPCVGDDRSQRAGIGGPVRLYSKIATGSLDMHIVTPSQGGNSTALGDSRKSTDKMSLPGYGGAREMSVSMVVVWKSENSGVAPLRILFAADALQRRLFDGLDRLRKTSSAFDGWTGLPAEKCGTKAATVAMRAAAREWKLPNVLPPKRSNVNKVSVTTKAASDGPAEASGKPRNSSGRQSDTKPQNGKGHSDHQGVATKQTTMGKDFRRSMDTVNKQALSDPESKDTRRQSTLHRLQKSTIEDKSEKKAEKSEQSDEAKDVKKSSGVIFKRPNCEPKVSAAASGAAPRKLGLKSETKDAKMAPEVVAVDKNSASKDTQSFLAPTVHEGNKVTEAHRQNARRSLASSVEGIKRPMDEDRDAEKMTGKPSARNASNSAKPTGQKNKKKVGSSAAAKSAEAIAVPDAGEGTLNATVDAEAIKPSSATSTPKKSNGETVNAENAEAVNIVKAVSSLSAKVWPAHQSENRDDDETTNVDIKDIDVNIFEDGGMDVNAILPKSSKPRRSYFPELSPTEPLLLPSNEKVIMLNSFEGDEENRENQSEEFVAGSEASPLNEFTVNDEERSMNEEERSGNDQEHLVAKNPDRSVSGKADVNDDGMVNESLNDEERAQMVRDPWTNDDFAQNSQFHSDFTVNDPERAVNGQNQAVNDEEAAMNDPKLALNDQEHAANDEELLMINERPVKSQVHENGIHWENCDDAANVLMENCTLPHLEPSQTESLASAAASMFLPISEAVPSILDQSFPDQSFLEQSNLESSSPLKSTLDPVPCVTSDANVATSVKTYLDLASPVKSITEQFFPEESVLGDTAQVTPSGLFDPVSEWERPQSLPSPPSPVSGDGDGKMGDPEPELTESIASNDDDKNAGAVNHDGASSHVDTSGTVDGSQPADENPTDGIPIDKKHADGKSAVTKKHVLGKPVVGKSNSSLQSAAATGKPAVVEKYAGVAKPVSTKPGDLVKSGDFAKPSNFAKPTSSRGSGNTGQRAGTSDRLNFTSIEPPVKQSAVVKRSRLSLMPGELSTLQSSFSHSSLSNQSSGATGRKMAAATTKSTATRRPESAMGSTVPVKPFYVDVAFVPNHGDGAAEFFARVRARYYVLNAANPDSKVIAELVGAKSVWGGDGNDREVTLIPTHDSEELIGWVAANQGLLEKLKVEVTVSASGSVLMVGGEAAEAAACNCYRLEL